MRVQYIPALWYYSRDWSVIFQPQVYNIYNTANDITICGRSIYNIIYVELHFLLRHTYNTIIYRAVYGGTHKFSVVSDFCDKKIYHDRRS